MVNIDNIKMRATRFGFGEAIRDAARTNDKIIGIGADISKSTCMNIFADEFPSRFYSLGIAEQNCISVACGMALSGYIPVFSTYGVFAATRSLDQIRVSACYNNLHIIIGGAHSGISVGQDGATHQALEDIATIRVLPNMTLLSPCDSNQAYALTKAAINQNCGPVYIRFGREDVPNFTEINQQIEIGKGQILHEGNDIAIIATGHLCFHAIEAAIKLKKQGIHARVINIHTIKPLDKKIIIDAAKDCKAIVTAEEHQITGGLGSAVAETIVENYPIPMKIIGINDKFGESGKPEELMNNYGLSTKNIYDQCIKLLSEKK